VENRFYLQALGITGLFVVLLVLFWIASGGVASEAAIRNANSTRTSIAMTGAYLLQPRTQTPLPATGASSSGAPLSTPTAAGFPSPTNTSLLAQFNTPLDPGAPTLAALPSQTTAPIPVFTTTVLPSRDTTKAPPLVPRSPTPTAVQGLATPIPATQVSTAQSPAEFAAWYFTRVWNERDYQNLWDNYLTTSFKTNVGSGLFEDYVFWWESVQRVQINAVDVLQNNGVDALVRVNLTFHMKDGRVVENQMYNYDFLYDSARGSWMFDSSQ
jgi:hypothetical protein